MADNKQLDNLLQKLSQRLGTDPQKLKESAQSGDMSKTLGNLNPQDAEKVKKVLEDKDATNKLLSSPQAQQLIKKLLGEK